MNEQEIRELARQAAQEAVSQTFARFRAEVKEAADEGVTAALERVGIDPNDPTEVQQDFAFLRDWRITTRSVRRKGILTGVGILVAGAMAAIWLGVKALWPG